MVLIGSIGSSIVAQMMFCGEALLFFFFGKAQPPEYNYSLCQDSLNRDYARLVASDDAEGTEMLFPLDQNPDHDKYLKSTLVINPFKDAGF